MNDKDIINSRLEALGKSRFRAKFHLQGKEREMVLSKGLETISEHALDIISKRLAPFEPLNDGKQTPFKGHPVFLAQHATATCCRGCIFKWHNIEKGWELTKEEIEFIADLVEAWIKKELGIK